MNNKDESDKIAIISGATKGLGKGLSLEFARAGYEIIGLYRSDEDSAKILETEFHANNLQGIFIKQDIAEDGDWTEFNKIIKKCSEKKITFIANACLPFVPKPFHLIEWEEISQQIEVNVKGTFSLVKRLLPLMVKRREGIVISVLTEALNPPTKGFAAYIIAKSALETLTKITAIEYQTRGIRAFSVSPGFMETSLTSGWSEHFKALTKSNDENPHLPNEYAEKILQLAENPELIGQGENYLLDII